MPACLTPPSLHNPKDAPLAIKELRRARRLIAKRVEPFLCWALDGRAHSSPQRPVATALIDWITQCLGGADTVSKWLRDTLPADYERLVSTPEYGSTPHSAYRLAWIDAMIAELEQYTEQEKKG